MDKAVCKPLNLEKYRCRCCGRYFYISRGGKTGCDLEFGCPYGCDDNGLHIADLRAAVIALR
jgi:hypothetical protein